MIEYPDKIGHEDFTRACKRKLSQSLFFIFYHTRAKPKEVHQLALLLQMLACSTRRRDE